MNVPIKYVLSSQIYINYMLICPMGTSHLYVLETQMHTILQGASFTIHIYVPDTYNLNISTNMF